MKIFLINFIVIAFLSSASAVEKSYCEITKFSSNCSSGDVVLIEKNYMSSLTFEDLITKYCSFDHEIVELTDKYAGDNKILCVLKEPI